MAKLNLTFPSTRDKIRALRTGDVVTISGTVIGLRDATLIRIFDQGIKPPWDLTGAVCLHTAPGVKKSGGTYEKICVGTTTSTRMDRFTEGLLRDYGVCAIMGKAGLLDNGARALQACGGCYLGMVGGAAALSTLQIEAIEEVAWEDLMPECLWRFRVKDFGPVIVGIDSHGGNLYQEVKEAAKKKIDEILMPRHI